MTTVVTFHQVFLLSGVLRFHKKSSRRELQLVLVLSVCLSVYTALAGIGTCLVSVHRLSCNRYLSWLSVYTALAVIGT